MKFIDELSQLVFPQRCIGCLSLGPAICSLCRVAWHPHLYTTHVENLVVTSAILYSPIAARILIAAKERNQSSADILIIDALRHLVKNYRGNLANLTLIPIPSSKNSARKRGRNFIVDICDELDISYSNILFHQRRVRDQSGLNAHERKQNLVGAFGVESRARIYGDIVLIDDVVTTGSTLREAYRALSAGGLKVSAAITACVAQPLR
jgi:predicted amidophosphoribosyltransferase